MAALLMRPPRIPFGSRWRTGAPQILLSVILLALIWAENARSASPGSGLVLTEDNSATDGGNFVTTPSLAATFGPTDAVSGDGPLAITIASTLPGRTTASVSAAVGEGRNWLQIAPLDSSGNCPSRGDRSYTESIPFTLTKSQTSTICVLALPENAYSVFAGMLSFQTQTGTTIVPVTYTVVPSAYLTVSNTNTNSVLPNGSSMLFQQPTNVNLRVTAQDPNGSSVNTPVVVSPAAGSKPNWLSISTNDLTGLPSTLTIGVDPTLAHQNQSTVVEFQALGGYGTVGFTFQVQPPVNNSLPNPLVAVWRPQNGFWFLAPPQSPATTQWGLSGDIPVPGDYDGDGKIDFAVWRPSTGTWFVIPSSGSGAFARQWGLAGDIPVPADYDGDGRTDFAVWRPNSGVWYVIPSGGAAPYALQWGLAGDVPVPADYDRVGHAEITVWRPSNGSWYAFPNSANPKQWGLPGDVPVPADYDGDGRIDIAVWRPSAGLWFIIPSGGSGAYAQQWGLAGDIPVPGDFDGDGKIDLAVWRLSTGTWYILPSSSPGSQAVKQWGLPNDVPLARIPGH